MTKLYAVKIGRQPGIYMTWPEAEKQVKGFSGAQYKSFKSSDDAVAYMSDTAPAPVAPAFEAPIFVAPVNQAEIYTDGSYRMGSYTWAIVVVINGQVVHSDAGVGTNADAVVMNNVAGELAASMRAAQWAVKNNMTAVIIHDYEGVAAWAEGSWKAKNSFTQSYSNYMSGKPVTFKQIKGHSGNTFNDMADKLAKAKLPPM